MVLILLVLTRHRLPAPEAQQRQPRPRLPGGQRLPGRHPARDPRARLRQAPPHPVRPLRGRTCCTATSRCRCGPGARSPPTSAPTCPPPSSWPSPAGARRACWAPPSGWCRRPGSGGRASSARLLLALASAPVFLLALLAILWISGDLHLLPGDRATPGTPTRPPGPTGMIVIDGLLHGQPAIAWDGVAPPDPARHRGGPRAGRLHRPRPARLPRGVDVVRVRPHGPGQGPEGADGGAAPRPAQLGQRRPVDDRAPGRPDVRRRGGGGVHLRLARHRSLRRPEHPRRPTSRPSPGSPWSSASGT